MDTATGRYAHIYTQDLALPFCGIHEYASDASLQFNLTCFAEDEGRRVCAPVVPCRPCVRAEVWGIENLYCHDYHNGSHREVSVSVSVSAQEDSESQEVLIVADTNGYSPMDLHYD